MINTTNEAINNEGTEFMQIDKEDIRPEGKKMTKRNMKKFVKPALFFGAGAATCYVGVKVVPTMLAKRAAGKATEVVVDTVVDSAITTAASVASDVAAGAASALIGF